MKKSFDRTVDNWHWKLNLLIQISNPCIPQNICSFIVHSYVNKLVIYQRGREAKIWYLYQAKRLNYIFVLLDLIRAFDDKQNDQYVQI